jgi:uncharacterized repeat protein (TIGR01451 family)
VGGPVPTGGQVPVSFDWTVRATTEPITVYAEVDPDGTSGDRDRSNNEQHLTLALPDLQVTAAGASALGDTTVSVVARVTNNGSTGAPESDFKFRLDSETGAVLYQETIPALAVGQSVDVGFVLETDGLSNGAVVVALSDEANAVVEYDETNNASSLSLSLEPPSVDVGVTLGDAPDPVVVGSDLVYTATATNSGPDSASGVTLTMAVPSGASYASALATQGDCSEASGAITCPLGTLEAGGEVTVTVTVSPGEAGLLDAAVSVSATEADTDPTNDQAVTSTTVLAAGLGFYTVEPCRALDTRDAAGPYGGPALAANTSRTFTIAGQCGIPPTAKGVSVNLTVTQAAAPGNLRLYPNGIPLPLVSSINYTPGITRANNAIVPLNELGEMAVYCSQASGTVQFVLDVNGYFE